MKRFLSFILLTVAVCYVSAQNLWVTLEDENWSGINSIEFVPIGDGTDCKVVMHGPDGVDVSRDLFGNWLYITDLTVERNALEALYKALDGDNWANNTNWCSDKHPSEWYGIRANEGHVWELELVNNRLKGVLPEEIGDLNYLRWFNLSTDASPDHNVITGSIPESIGKLLSLIHI